MERLIFNLKHEFERVPKNQSGLYQFGLRFPTDYELGINEITNGPDLDRVLNLIKAKVDRYVKLFHSYNLPLDLIDPKHHHLRNIYNININSAKFPSDILSKDQEMSKSQKNLVKLLTLLRYTLDNSPPIYVGITKEQSLYGRLTQHLRGETAVRGFINQKELTWDDISFTCFVDEEFLSKDKIRIYEKLLQNIHKPIISTR